MDQQDLFKLCETIIKWMSNRLLYLDRLGRNQWDILELGTTSQVLMQWFLCDLLLRTLGVKIQYLYLEGTHFHRQKGRHQNYRDIHCQHNTT